MRRRMALIVVCALAVIGSVFGHGPVISGMRLKADVQPVRIPVADKPAIHAAPAMKTVEFHGYAFKVPASWPVYQLSKDPNQCVRYDVNAVYLGTPGPNQHCPPGLVGTHDTVTVGGPAIPGVLVVSSATNRRAQVGDLRSGTDLPAAPGTIMQNPGQHEFAISMPTHAPSFTATYGTDPALVRGGDLPPLQRIHDSVYEMDAKARRSLECHRTKTTEEMVESLRPGQAESLKVKPDGRVFQGNMRIKVLGERGYPIDEFAAGSDP